MRYHNVTRSSHLLVGVFHNDVAVNLILLSRNATTLACQHDWATWDLERIWQVLRRLGMKGSWSKFHTRHVYTCRYMYTLWLTIPLNQHGLLGTTTEFASKVKSKDPKWLCTSETNDSEDSPELTGWWCPMVSAPSKMCSQRLATAHLPQVASAAGGSAIDAGSSLLGCGPSWENLQYCKTRTEQVHKKSEDIVLMGIPESPAWRWTVYI